MGAGRGRHRSPAGESRGSLTGRSRREDGGRGRERAGGRAGPVRPAPGRGRGPQTPALVGCVRLRRLASTLWSRQERFRGWKSGRLLAGRSARLAWASAALGSGGCAADFPKHPREPWRFLPGLGCGHPVAGLASGVPSGDSGTAGRLALREARGAGFSLPKECVLTSPRWFSVFLWNRLLRWCVLAVSVTHFAFQ